MLASYNQAYTAYGKNSVSYNQGLPRPSNTFTEGAFGPLAPIIPAPIDVPRDDTGRPEPRRWQYPVGWNLPIGVPGSEGLKLVPFATLRSYAEVYSVVRACIELRKAEILALEWDVVPTEGAEKAMRADSGMHMDFMTRKEAAVQFFKNPDPNFNSFSSWLSALLEDVFVVDAVAIYIHPSKMDGKGLFGTNLASMDLLDGTTVRPLLDIRGGKPKPPAPAFQQYLFGIPRVDLMDVIMENDTQDLGAPAAEYRADQMLYFRSEPRSWTPYGLSGLERAIIPVITGIKKQQYAMDWFTEGTIPGSWVTPGPDVSTPAQQRELQETLNAIAGDVGFKHKIIVLPPGSKTEPQKPPSLADQFDAVLMNQVCMAYEISPMEIGILPKVAETQSPSQSNQAQQAASQSAIDERKSLKPLLIKLKTEIFDYILQKYCGQTDMQWSWKALDTTQDAETQASTFKTLVSTGLMSVDEARVEMGKNPWGLPQTSDPVLITGTGVIPFGQISPEEAEAELGLPPIASPDEVAVAVQQQQAQAQSQAIGGPGAPPPGGTPPAGGAQPPKPPAPPGGGGAPPQNTPGNGQNQPGPTHPQTGEPLKTNDEGKPLHPETGKPLHSDSPLLQGKPEHPAVAGANPPPQHAAFGASQHALPQNAPTSAPAHDPSSGQAVPQHNAPSAPVPPHGAVPPGAAPHAQPQHSVDPKSGQPIPSAHTAPPSTAAVHGAGAPAGTPQTPPRPTAPPVSHAPTPPPHTDPASGRPVGQIPPGGAHSPQGQTQPHPGAAPTDPKTGQPLKTDEKTGKPLHPETGKPLHSDSPLLQGAHPTDPNSVPQPAAAGHDPAAPKPAQPSPTPQSPHDGIPIPPAEEQKCPNCGGNGWINGDKCPECGGTGFVDNSLIGQQPAQTSPAPEGGPQAAHPTGDAHIGPDGSPLEPSREPGAPPPQAQGGQRPGITGNRASQESNTQTTPNNPVVGASSPTPPSTQARKPVAKRSAASDAMLEELEMLRKHLKQRGTRGRRWEAQYVPQELVDDIYKQLDDPRSFFS